MSLAATHPDRTDDASGRHDQRVADHAAAVVGPRGPAAFVWGDFVIGPGTVVSGAPGTWSPRTDGGRGLLVTATPADGIRIGDELVDGSVTLHASAADGPAVASFPDGAEGIVFSYDDTAFALQVWNPGSDWTRRFAGISAYPFDPSWIVAAEVAPVADGRTVAITHHRDPRPVEAPIVAEVRFVRHDRSHTLLATNPGPGHDGLVLLFTDRTSGVETYRAGRILHIASADAGPRTLDFNETTLLPCAFSLAWNCPIPSADNALDIPVRAGERSAIDHDGKELL